MLFIFGDGKTMDAPHSLCFPAFLRYADYSLLRCLSADPEQARHAPNKKTRQVKSGHYVEVLPTALPDPQYVIHSQTFFHELNLSESVASEGAFMAFFTGRECRERRPCASAGSGGRLGERLRSEYLRARALP